MMAASRPDAPRKKMLAAADRLHAKSHAPSRQEPDRLRPARPGSESRTAMPGPLHRNRAMVAGHPPRSEPVRAFSGAPAGPPSPPAARPERLDHHRPPGGATIATGKVPDACWPPPSTMIVAVTRAVFVGFLWSGRTAAARDARHARPFRHSTDAYQRRSIRILRLQRYAGATDYYFLSTEPLAEPSVGDGCAQPLCASQRISARKAFKSVTIPSEKSH
jgi:hypothetical protein